MKSNKLSVAIGIMAIGIFACCNASAENKKTELGKGEQLTGLVVKKDEKIAFLGDSITAGGTKKNGYVTLVMAALNQEDLNLTHVAAGKSGHRSNDMLGRLDNDVISKKPQWMILSCGVNDVWHFKLRLGKRTFTGVPLEDYKKNITAIIEKTQAADIKIMVLTSTMIGEDPSRELNQNLIPYNEFLKKIAAEKNCLLADLNTDMQEALTQIPDIAGKTKIFGEPKNQGMIKNKLTTDGCHMNARGNIMMAKGILKTFGLSEEKIDAAEKSWLGK
jgi:lysophospholipase L1-like esterase